MRALGLLLALLPSAPAAGSLEAAVFRATPGTWVEYAAPLVDGVGSPCCLDWENGRVRSAQCELDGRSWSFSSGPDAPHDHSLRVFVRRGTSGPDRVRAVGASCAIDTGSAQVAAVTGIDAAAAATYLGSVAAAMGKSNRGETIAAIALHDGQAATEALARLASPGQSESVRRDALFWLGEARGDAGLPVLRETLASETDDDVLRHAVFALSQSGADAARPALRDLARTDRRPEVRGEALFWLSQRKDPQTEALARAALADGSGKAIRDKAVFALSQLPAGRAIPALEALARDRSLDAATRREALFWLAQQDDDRALDVFDELLGTDTAGR